MKLAISIAICAVLASACSAQEPVAKTTAPLYVDAIGGGHGPFTCSGAVPGRGYVDLYTGASYTGTCYRWRGDFADDSGATHLGYVIWPWDNVGSIKISPTNPANGDTTLANYCEGQPQLPTGCDPHFRRLPFTTNQPTVSWSYGPIVLQYVAPCPNTPGETHFYQCVGTATPIDDSGYASAVISNGVVASGLPRGQPLFSSNSNSLATDCMADLATFGLTSLFTAPVGYKRGTRVAAVYACP